MSRKVTTQVVAAFLSRTACSVGNTHTDGNTLYLHGNAIAEHRTRGTIRVTLSGWNTTTTRERLSGLPGVSVRTRKGQAYLNGTPWGGQWTTIHI